MSLQSMSDSGCKPWRMLEVYKYRFYLAVLLSLTLVCLVPGNARATEQCKTLFAGQTINAGTVCLDNSADMLMVTYRTTGGWLLNDMHLFIGKSLSEMPQTKTGNPQIGKFPLTASGNGATEYTFRLPLGDYGTYGDTLVVAAHADLMRTNADGSMSQETGWGDGLRMVAKGNWATYFTYVIQYPVVTGTCKKTETAFALGDQVLQDLGTRINRWGWQITVDAVHGISGQVPLYAGAAQNDITKGTWVGMFSYSYVNGLLTVTFSTFNGFGLNETHVYAGNTYVSTGAPGQFGNLHERLPYGTNLDSYQIVISDPENDGIFVVGHATICYK